MSEPEKNDTPEIFNREKPSGLKQIFQTVGAFLGGVSGDGINYGWDQAGATYDYAKTWLGSKGIGLKKPSVT